MKENMLQIENLIEAAVMGDNHLTKLDGIKSARTFRTMMSLQLYIICDNGDIIQMIYEFGTRKIYATLVGLHRSNGAHIPVCRDEIAREELIDDLMHETSYAVLSSDRTSCYMEFSGYAFQHSGHVVYYLKCVYMDIRMVKRSFRRIVEDVLRMHKDGTLLDIVNMRADQFPLLPKEITNEWVLC